MKKKKTSIPYAFIALINIVIQRQERDGYNARIAKAGHMMLVQEYPRMKMNLFVQYVPSKLVFIEIKHWKLIKCSFYLNKYPKSILILMILCTPLQGPLCPRTKGHMGP